MTTSILRITAALGAVLVTTAAVCNRDAGESATPEASLAAAAPAASSASGGSGLPADFPIDPALSPCKPIITGPEVTCDWHNVDGHAAYSFYRDALPKAGYVVLPGSQEVPPSAHYLAAIRFTKGDIKGGITIAGGELSVQLVTGY